MAKWRSESVVQEVKNPDGSVKQQGVVAWVPVNDAAKADKARVDKVVQLGKYKPSSPDEADEIALQLKEKQLEAAKRKGLVPRNYSVVTKQ